MKTTLIIRTKNYTGELNLHGSYFKGLSQIIDEENKEFVNTYQLEISLVNNFQEELDEGFLKMLRENPITSSLVSEAIQVMEELQKLIPIYTPSEKLKDLLGLLKDTVFHNK